jgi:hypothetical protein
MFVEFCNIFTTCTITGGLKKFQRGIRSFVLSYETSAWCFRVKGENMFCVPFNIC